MYIDLYAKNTLCRIGLKEKNIYTKKYFKYDSFRQTVIRILITIKLLI